MEFVKVRDHENLVRDPLSNGIINTNNSDYDEYIARRESAKEQQIKSSNM